MLSQWSEQKNTMDYIMYFTVQLLRFGALSERVHNGVGAGARLSTLVIQISMRG